MNKLTEGKSLEEMKDLLIAKNKEKVSVIDKANEEVKKLDEQKNTYVAEQNKKITELDNQIKSIVIAINAEEAK